ncbi:MAG TPA: hypothetical protein VLX92_20425, partial [Kofleriaceae bacterium]|nr:hypothetical protein [Kofleriaceae bacterium]
PVDGACRGRLPARRCSLVQIYRRALAVRTSHTPVTTAAIKLVVGVGWDIVLGGTSATFDDDCL